MDAERLREFLLNLPHVEETMQWGENLVFWAGDKAVGGKMFALASLDGTGKGVLSFHAGSDRYDELLENEGVIPAPYMARIYWVCLERWDALPQRELEALLTRAYELVYNKLSKRTKDVLAMPSAQRRKLIAERRKLLASRKSSASDRPCHSEREESAFPLTRVVASRKNRSFATLRMTPYSFRPVLQRPC